MLGRSDKKVHLKGGRDQSGGGGRPVGGTAQSRGHWGGGPRGRASVGGELC